VQLPPNKKIYFLSDFHLGAPDHERSLEREKTVVEFLEKVKGDAAEIFIVGDIFDFWYEYRKVVPKGYVRLLGKLAEITDNVLYGDVWERPELSKRDRSLATVSALIALNRPDQLRSHLAIARQNGVTQEELIETITHLAFYAGWPNAVSAIAVAREVFEKN